MKAQLRNQREQLFWGVVRSVVVAVGSPRLVELAPSSVRCAGPARTRVDPGVV
jgi:hypothetical protein